jgi:DUF1009 family protein
MGEGRILGLIAGGGTFPFLVADRAREQGRSVVAIGYANNTDPALGDHVDEFHQLKLGQLGKAISLFRKAGVDEVVMAGPINKAGALSMRPDLRAAKLVLGLKRRGDDSLLRAIMREFAAEDMPVIPPQRIVPELLTPPGLLSARKPTKREWADIRYAWPLVKALGEMDIGQTVIVRDSMVVAVEAMEGTDEAIRRAGLLARKKLVVVKAFKPGQDDRVDMPAAGAGTIEVMQRAGAGCLALEAGRSLLFDREEAVRAADASRIAIVGVSEDDFR